MSRFATAGVATSLLGVGSTVAISDVGLEPLGEVMGCIVEHVGWQGWTGCGAWSGFGAGRLAAVTSTRSSVFAGYRPYVDALNRGYDTALRRMLDEARAMGADGVVGIRLTMESVEGLGREFVALGTAVRARSRTHPAYPFTTDLAGTDVAKLMSNGWMPVSVAIGLEVAIRHDDYRTQRQQSWGAGNVEVSGYTELVQHSRHFANQRFAERINSVGAEGAVVSDMSLHVWEVEPSDGHTDHVAEAFVVGTTLVQYRSRPPAAARTLTMLPLTTGART